MVTHILKAFIQQRIEHLVFVTKMQVKGTYTDIRCLRNFSNTGLVVTAHREHLARCQQKLCPRTRPSPAIAPLPILFGYL